METSMITQAFNFENNQVTALRDEVGEILFNGREICTVLGYSAYRDVIAGLPDKMKRRVSVDASKRLETFITEPGLYRLTLRSQKSQAEKFQDWVCYEVLPSIRKTGQYNYQKGDDNLIRIIPETEKVFKSCKSLAEMFGLVGNQALLSASNATFAVTGVYIPELIGTTHLIAESQDRLSTPTDLGKKIGMSAQQFNKHLESVGYQTKDENGWFPTELGKEFSVLTDTGKRHKSGRPVQQLLWKESVLKKMPLAA